MQPESAERQQPERQRPSFDSQAMLSRVESLDFPVAQNSQRIRDAFAAHDRLILEAATGSGKTSLAPPLFLHELLKSDPDARMLVTQPRRLATKAMADYLGEDKLVGHQFVDYHYADHPATKPDAKIVFTVEQSAINMLQKDPMLLDYDAFFLDEVHERSISIDLLLPLLKKAQALRKAAGEPQLKIVLASGTLDAPKFLDYFNNDGSGVVHVEKVEGRSYPVTESFATSEILLQDAPEKAAQKAAQLLSDPSKTGDMLIFMPGNAEIEATEEALASLVGEDVEIVKLKGGKDEDSLGKINGPRIKPRRIYVATNVAETSITIKGITMVIDSGWMRKNLYDPNTRTSSLKTLKHAEANWKQRAGRAGRTQPGEAHALFTKADLASRQIHQQAEVSHSDMVPLVLKMKASGIDDVYNFDYIDQPKTESMDNAIDSLKRLGALDKDGKVTEIGKEMAEFNEDDPHFARMLVEAKRNGCVDEIALLVGAMKTRESVFNYNNKDKNFHQKYAEFIDPTSDFITYLNVWNDYMKNVKDKKNWAGERFNIRALQNATREKNNMIRGLDRAFDLSPERKKAISMSVAAGLTDRLVEFGAKGYKFADKRQADGIAIDNMSAIANRKPEAFVSLAIRSGGNRIFVGMNQQVDKSELYKEFNYLETSQEKRVEQNVDRKEQQSQPHQEAPEEEISRVNAVASELQELDKKVNDDEPTPAEEKEIQSTFKRISESIKNFPKRIKARLMRIARKLRLA